MTYEYAVHRIDTMGMFLAKRGNCNCRGDEIHWKHDKEGHTYDVWKSINLLGEVGWKLVTAKWADGDEGVAFFMREVRA